MEDDLPPPEPIEGKKDGTEPPPEPPQKEADADDTELQELYNLIDERDRELAELRAQLDAAIARIGKCESAIGTLRTHNHEEHPGPEERHIWFKHIGR